MCHSGTMVIVTVYVHVKADCVEKFIRATRENAENSRKEPGIARFDVIQEAENPTRFMLIEAYRNAEAPAAHKETSHYMKWRDAVESMMAEPRTNRKYVEISPDESGW